MPETSAKETGITIHLDERARKITLAALRRHLVALTEAWSLLGYADCAELEATINTVNQTVAALENKG